MEPTYEITVTVNGERSVHRVAARQSLADFLREEMGLTGTHVGCEQGVCGACTVRFNGEQIRACLMFAVQADGARVDTVEGLTADGSLATLQDAFHRNNALQCGFCTPGMLMAAADLLARNTSPSREEIRAAMSGNFCRCTGYHAIVDAVAEAAQANGDDAP